MALQAKRKMGDDDAEDDVSPFFDLRKNVVLRETRLFSETPLNSVKCSQVITKVLYLETMGETLSREEATEVFFAVTKLFQCNDPHLRRLVYLILKTLTVDSDNSLIVVSCLSKDMTSKIDLYRGNSIRVLAKIMDSAMVGQMERFLKQGLVEKNSFITASTTLASQQLYTTAPDTIKRWINEITDNLNNNRNKFVQYHSLILLHRIRSHDRLAINKIVQQLINKQTLNHSPLATVYLIRIVFHLLQTQPSSQPLNPELLAFLNECLHHKSFIVLYEAARSICSLNAIQAVQCVSSVSVLQELLTSSISIHRFAAVRQLSEIVLRFPGIVAVCNSDLEHLISDSNRSIATLAITTLLKTGQEGNVDRLMKSISGFMNDISDEFKIVLIDAIKVLALKFPHKHASLLNFLATSLREEGGYKYKKQIVDNMCTIIAAISEALELGLEHFCEFIEDCEFSELSVRILYLLGEKGPTTSNPAKYIRFIFNRVILETAAVRSAAVSSLAAFGVALPQLTDNITVLLKRCINDNDDEVRERALFYLHLFEKQNNDKTLVNELISANVNFSKLNTSVDTVTLLPSLHQFEASLKHYIDEVSQDKIDEDFNLKQHLIMVAEEEVTAPVIETDGININETSAQTTTQQQPQQQQAATVTLPSGTVYNPHAELLHSIPELRALGTLFKSCQPVDCTESESEYVVQCIKHIFSKHVVFQFNVTNNMEEQQLENVLVQCELTADDEAVWQEELSIPERKIKYQESGVCFTVFQRVKDDVFTSSEIQCVLHFNVRDVDPSDGTVDENSKAAADEYQLEPVQVSESDFMRIGENMGLIEFRRSWESLSDAVELVKKYSLGLDSLQSAVSAVIELLGMQACENSGTVAEGARSHAINLTGRFFGDVTVLVRAGLVLDAQHGVTLKIAIRSHNQAINQMLTNAIR